MPNKTPSYKDKVIEDYNELRKQVAGHYDIALPPEVFSFISQALEEQAKEFLAVFPEDTRTQIYEKSRLKENLKSKGLIK